MREFHRARIPMGSRDEISGLRSVLLIETYMARKRMAYSALRKYVSLERSVLMGAFLPQLGSCVSLGSPPRRAVSFFSRQLPNRRTLVLLKRNGFVESDGHKCEMYAQTIFNPVKRCFRSPDGTRELSVIVLPRRNGMFPRRDFAKILYIYMSVSQRRTVFSVELVVDRFSYFHSSSVHRGTFVSPDSR